MIAYALLACDPELVRLFTPLRPQLGVYEVCTTRQSIEEVAAERGLHAGPIELMEALDAFGSAGAVHRPALARLYGGTRAKVSRGWRDEGDRFESVTLVSPYPAPSLERLESGTLVIRWMVSRREPFSQHRSGGRAEFP